MAFTTFLNTPFNEGAPYALCSPGAALATGFRVTMGNGGGTALHLSDQAVGIFAPSGQMTRITSQATVQRDVWFRDSAGALEPAFIAVLAADATRTSETLSAVAAFMAGLQANTTYEIDATLVLTSAATGTAPKIQLTGPGAMSFIAAEFEQLVSATPGTGNNFRGMSGSSGFSFVFQPSGSPVSGAVTFIVKIRGMIRTSGTVSAGLGISLATSVASSTITLKAGSVLRARKVAD